MKNLISTEVDFEAQDSAKLNLDIDNGGLKMLCALVIERAINDLKTSDTSHFDSAYQYIHSPVFSFHCETMGLDENYVRNLAIYRQSWFIPVQIQMRKSRHILGSESELFKKTVEKIIDDTNKFLNLNGAH